MRAGERLFTRREAASWLPYFLCGVSSALCTLFRVPTGLSPLYPPGCGLERLLSFLKEMTSRATWNPRVTHTLLRSTTERVST